MISLDSWAEIRHLRSEGLSIRAIAARVGCAKKTVERALASDLPPSYKKRARGAGVLDEYEPLVRALLARYPSLPASVLAERVGWKGSGSCLTCTGGAVFPCLGPVFRWFSAVVFSVLGH